MADALHKDAQKLAISEQENGHVSLTPAPRKAAEAVVNKAVVGEWEDAVKAYKGPKLHQFAVDSPSWYGAERLDHLFRTSGWGVSI